MRLRPMLNDFSTSNPKNAIKKLYANKKWIPYANDGCGNNLGLDFDPDENGVIGQVINFGRDEDDKVVIANSFSEFIDWFVKELESGNFDIEVDEEVKIFNIKKPTSSHFLDSVIEIFGKT